MSFYERTRNQILRDAYNKAKKEHEDAIISGTTITPDPDPIQELWDRINELDNEVGQLTESIRKLQGAR